MGNFSSYPEYDEKHRNNKNSFSEKFSLKTLLSSHLGVCSWNNTASSLLLHSFQHSENSHSLIMGDSQKCLIFKFSKENQLHYALKKQYTNKMLLSK